MKTRMIRLLATAGLILGMFISSASPASASDWGGYKDPSWWYCGSNYVVREEPVYANGATGRWYNVGKLQIKWSNGCPGNYARFQANSGYMPRSIGISIHSKASPYNKAGANERYTTTAWTRVIKLARSSDRVCAYLDVGVARPRWAGTFESTTLNGSKVVCA